jgi:hypothetical protein
MKKTQADDRARRIAALTIKAAQDREDIAAAYTRMCAPLDFNRAFAGMGRSLRSHPMITAGLSTVLVSGLGGKLLKGAVQLAALGRVALPLWTWWKNRKDS